MWQRANRELKEINMTMDSDGINLRKMTRLMQECAEELEKAGYEDPAYYFEQIEDLLRSGKKLPITEREVGKALGL